MFWFWLALVITVAFPFAWVFWARRDGMDWDETIFFGVLSTVGVAMCSFFIITGVIGDFIFTDHIVGNKWRVDRVEKIVPMNSNEWMVPDVDDGVQLVKYRVDYGGYERVHTARENQVFIVEGDGATLTVHETYSDSMFAFGSGGLKYTFEIPKDR